MKKALIFSGIIILVLIVVSVLRAAFPAELTLEEAKKIPVAPPGKVEVEMYGSSTNLKWLGTASANVSFYVLYKNCTDGDWEKIMTVPVANDNSEFYSVELESSEGCVYTVSSVSVYGVEGPKSIDVHGVQEEKSNWKSYRNEEYGFELKYPEEKSVSIRIRENKMVEGDLIFQKKTANKYYFWEGAGYIGVFQLQLGEDMLEVIYLMVDGGNKEDSVKEGLDKILSTFKFY